MLSQGGPIGNFPSGKLGSKVYENILFTFYVFNVITSHCIDDVSCLSYIQNNFRLTMKKTVSNNQANYNYVILF